MLSMRKLLIALVLTTSTAACSGDEPVTTDPLIEEDTGATVADTTTAETTEFDTGSGDTTTEDTGVASDTEPTDGGGDAILPLDTSVLADATDTAPADTAPADTAPADTGRPDAIADILADTPLVCTSVACTTNAQCAALGCGTCNTGPGRCRTP